MTCYRVRRLLNEYIDETLPIGVEERLRGHLGACPRCAKLAQELRRTVRMTQAMPHLETSPDFAMNLRRHLPVAVALSRRPSAPVGVLERFGRWWEHLFPRRLTLALVPVALALLMGVYAWHANSGGRQGGSLPLQPVISENDYLATLAQEHAGYAREHPLIDPSDDNLTVVSAKTDE